MFECDKLFKKKIEKIKSKIKEFNLKKFLKDFKKLSHSYLKTNVLFTTFVITSVINGCLLRFFTVKNYFAIKPILADLAIVLIIGAFGYFIKPKKQFRYFFTWEIIFTAICVIHSIYYNNYVSFASISLLSTSAQLGGMGKAVVENIMEFKDFSYILGIVILWFVHSSLKKRDYYEIAGKKERGKVRAVNTLIAGFLVLIIFLSTLTVVDLGRLAKQWNREYIVMKFGIYTYQINDLIASLKPQISPLFGYDKAAKEFREFYEKRDDKPEKNKYTDIFKDKNIIAIHAESIQNFTLDAEFNNVPVAPNLKKLSQEGLYFSNFYAQESVGTSSDTEFTFATSLLPASSGTVFVSYWNRDYLTIPKLLKEKNYYTFSMHGNNCNFWNRKTVHEKFGYDKFYCYTDDYKIDEKIGLGLSDKSFFRQSIPKIKEIKEKNEHFYGLMIMLTNHTPFTDIENYSDYAVDYKYEKENEITGEKETVSAPYLEGTTIGSYFKSVHYADEAIGEFIEALDKEGLLDDTVIVIYGDHDAKIKKKEYVRYYNYDYETDTVRDKDDPKYVDVDYYKYELNRKVPFIIWTKDGKYQKEVKKVMGMYDVLPTLGNMIDIRSPYQLGHDIFDIDKNIVIFPDGNWLTDSMYYNSQKEESMLLNPDKTINVDEVNKNSEYASILLIT